MKQLIKIRDDWFVLVRTISVLQVGDNMEGLKAWRDRLHCDHVLKQGGRYLMVKRVDHAKIV